MRILVTGAAGQLGTDLVAAAGAAGHDVVGTSHAELDVTDAAAVARAVANLAPEVVVHAAAWTAVDACEGDPQRAMDVNGAGTEHVVRAARAVGARVAYVSTDYVFDGTKAEPYVEDDEPNPVSAYGRSKLAGERALGTDDLAVRISWVCGPTGANMARTILRLLVSNPVLSFVDDQVGCPTITSDVAPLIVRLAADGRTGAWHATNQGAVSWWQFARDVAECAGEDPDRVRPIATADLVPPRPARRPANSVLDNRALRLAGIPLLPHYRESLPILVRRLQADLHG
ncbi:MAG: dTDP-4-dehydrorhamnose reductase [Acidobacteria bacterium]|nr:dTDP-4-dehydrorhamnose reductase [Acidobacteriota bacterium]